MDEKAALEYLMNFGINFDMILNIIPVGKELNLYVLSGRYLCKKKHVHWKAIILWYNKDHQIRHIEIIDDTNNPTGIYPQRSWVDDSRFCIKIADQIFTYPKSNFV